MFQIRNIDLRQSPLDTRDLIAESVFPATFKVPSTLDLRRKLQPIRDQGQQGTCAAQAAACMKEYQERIDIKFKDYFSPQFVYNLRQNQDSSGMTLRDVMKILNQKGICTEHDFQYGSNLIPNEEIIENASNHKIESYASIKSIDAVKKALYINGPCIIAFPVYNKGASMWKPEEKGQELKGGHAMTIVGYDKKGFIIRNSWSVKWGNKGYCIYPFNEWGYHWEIWTTIDAKSELLPSKCLC